jgi:hypothetical protein
MVYHLGCMIRKSFLCNGCYPFMRGITPSMKEYRKKKYDVKLKFVKHVEE